MDVEILYSTILVATDNSGLVVSYSRNPEYYNAATILVDAATNFTLTAYDGAGNSADCFIEVSLKGC